MNLYKYLFFLFFALFAKFSVAGVFEEKKEVKCGYAVSSTPSVEVLNEYGEIAIVTWEKDSVRIEAEIVGQADNPYDAEQLLNKVEVVCRGANSMITVSTEWVEGLKLLKRGVMDLKNLLNTDKKLNINYKIYLPANSRLSIKNRFGDVYLPDYEGPLRISLSHGDLRARTLTNARSLELRYGKASIRSLESCLLKLDFGSLILDKAKNLTLESKSSTLEILEVQELKLDSRNDELRIDRVSVIRGESTYSHILIKELDRLAYLNTSYGDLNIKKILGKVETINLNGNNTDFGLEFQEKTNLGFTIITEKEKGVIFSPQPDNLNEEEIEKDEKKYTGSYGTKPAKTEIKINQKNGFVNFYSR